MLFPPFAPLESAPLPPIYRAPPVTGAAICALERAAAAVGRLDHGLTGHPLAPGWTHWARLEATRRHAAADGYLIDPSRLAAMIEGLRLSVDHPTERFDRAAAHLALSHAFRLYQWMTEAAEPEEAEEPGELAAAMAHLRRQPADQPALIAAGIGLRSGLAAGIGRGPLRAALPAYLMTRGFVRNLSPILTGGECLCGAPPDSDGLAGFLNAVATAADDGRARLTAMTLAWSRAHAALAVRGSLSGQRRLRADAALPRVVDLLAAAPLIGPAQLARVLGCSLRGGAMMLDELQQRGIAVEVTGRRTHRLFGMSAAASIRPHTDGPRRRASGTQGASETRKAGAINDTANHNTANRDDNPIAPPPLSPRRPDRPALETDLAALLADTDRAIRRVRRILDALGSSPDG